MGPSVNYVCFETSCPSCRQLNSSILKQRMAESAAFQANAKANAKTKQIAKEHLLVAIARDNGIPCKSSLFREPALKVTYVPPLCPYKKPARNLKPAALCEGNPNETCFFNANPSSIGGKAHRVKGSQQCAMCFNTSSPDRVNEAMDKQGQRKQFTQLLKMFSEKGRMDLHAKLLSKVPEAHQAYFEQTKKRKI